MPRPLLALFLSASALCCQEPLVWTREGKASSTAPLDVPLGLQTGHRYSVLATLPDLDRAGDGMLRVELFDPTGMPTGKVLHAGDPDLHFVFRPRLAGESVLRIARSTTKAGPVKPVEDPARPAERDAAVVALHQDGAELADALRDGDGEVRVVDDDKFAGRSSLRVAHANAHFAKNVPGWGFRVREQPGPGEYRFLRFAWKLKEGQTAMLALADEGLFAENADPKRRYRAGQALPGLDAIDVGKDAPRGWVEVTRDLWKDNGAFTLTGIALLPCSGTLLFDHCYLARTLHDFDKVAPERVEAAIARGDSDGLEALALRAPPAAAAPVTTFSDELAWRVEIREVPLGPGDGKLLESEPNDDWRYADQIELGTPVRGGSDDIEYLENLAEGKVGWDWFRFTWREEQPRLVFFSLD